MKEIHRVDMENIGGKDEAGGLTSVVYLEFKQNKRKIRKNMNNKIWKIGKKLIFICVQNDKLKIWGQITRQK